ncbi:putative LRR receptor-like serine/threonine-protein kinase [Prunus yedoensis var. nudiflora]|uniref:Putative LRR receptor-like serine/threonine-protein kinase n=1 Tax=Prunus yedoensis var. nudiflora TaxID=2094558 RepID=A0A314Y2W6_PRUYE|nr:putative LRR receptor-like serine/threonine-protein kinase [Prunus yedoensis var. nudiflora]
MGSLSLSSCKRWAYPLLSSTTSLLLFAHGKEYSVMQKRKVIGLDVSRSELSGSIPDTTIGKLTKLQTLELSNNKITGLPSDLWSLGSLKYLNLSHNQISGSLPNNIGNFDGFVAAFPKLQILNLAGNEISGRDSDFSEMKSITSLNISGNMFRVR